MRYALETMTDPRQDGFGGAARPSRTTACVPPILRSRGEVDLSFRHRERRTKVGRSYQSGCLRVRVPRGESAAEPPCAVLMNTAGGVLEGDRLDVAVEWEEGAVAMVTSQAAEKVYRSLGTGCHISNSLTAARGSHAEWLPQETILFDAFRLNRDTRIVLAQDVSFLGLEAVVLGRTAMGETVSSGMLHDRMRIWREGRLIYADVVALGGNIAALMDTAAIGGGARAMAVIVNVSSSAAVLRDPLRDALQNARGVAAASCWDGILAVRLLARDGEALRHDIAIALSILRQDRPLPRVWKC